MCGRFTLFESESILSKDFDVKISFNLSPRYNIAPSHPILSVRISPESRKKEFTWFRWGLIPRWAKDPSIGNRMINARAETVAEKPGFRDAFRHRRCLIPASGFYEWKKEAKRKQPYYIRRKDGRPFAIAGLWERWQGSGDSSVESCTLITTESNALISSIHDRMPVIISPTVYELWLNAGDNPADRDCLFAMLQPFPEIEMEALPVGLYVNNPKADDQRCIIPADSSAK